MLDKQRLRLGVGEFVNMNMALQTASVMRMRKRIGSKGELTRRKTKKVNDVSVVDLRAFCEAGEFLGHGAEDDGVDGIEEIPVEQATEPAGRKEGGL